MTGIALVVGADEGAEGVISKALNKGVPGAAPPLFVKIVRDPAGYPITHLSALRGDVEGESGAPRVRFVCMCHLPNLQAPPEDCAVLCALLFVYVCMCACVGGRVALICVSAWMLLPMWLCVLARVRTKRVS